MFPFKTTVENFMAQVVQTHSLLPEKEHPTSGHQAVNGWTCARHPDTPGSETPTDRDTQDLLLHE